MCIYIYIYIYGVYIYVYYIYTHNICTSTSNGTKPPNIPDDSPVDFVLCL